jgi:hypothetical protein
MVNTINMKSDTYNPVNLVRGKKRSRDMINSVMGSAIAMIAAKGCNKGNLRNEKTNVLYSKSLLIEVYKNNRSNSALIVSANMLKELFFGILVDEMGITLHYFGSQFL